MMVFNKSEYDMKYAKEKLKRIPFDVTKEYYEQIKEYADQHDMKVNQLIKTALAEYMENH